jgi:hypothetical protein
MIARDDFMDNHQRIITCHRGVVATNYRNLDRSATPQTITGFPDATIILGSLFRRAHIWDAIATILGSCVVHQTQESHIKNRRQRDANCTNRNRDRDEPRRDGWLEETYNLLTNVFVNAEK